MANPEHLEILNAGTTAWNQWRVDNRDIKPDLSAADLSGKFLLDCNFVETNLMGANLSGATLMGSNFSWANLSTATFVQAGMSHVNLSYANCYGARFEMCNMRQAQLIKTNLQWARITGCIIHGLSAWNVDLANAAQSNLIITDPLLGEALVTVDDLEVAQFVYLMLHNHKIRSLIDTVTTKAVLILGRFTDERKAVLAAVQEALRQRGYVPILFDFDKPANRDLTETVMILAGMARFVIADLSDPHSIPHELMSFGEKLLSVPIQAIFSPVPEHQWEYPMYEHLARFPHVLPVYRYDSQEHLIATLGDHVIAPAEAKAAEMRPATLW